VRACVCGGVPSCSEVQQFWYEEQDINPNLSYAPGYLRGYLQGLVIRRNSSGEHEWYETLIIMNHHP
jgi:hypothetical protein